MEEKQRTMRRINGLTSSLILAGALVFGGCSKPSDNSSYPQVYGGREISMRIGTYKGHRVEVFDDEFGERINLYNVPYTPDIRLGVISAIDTNKDGTFDLIIERNLLPNDSLREFSGTDILGKARSHVMTNGFLSMERR